MLRDERVVLYDTAFLLLVVAVVLICVAESCRVERKSTYYTYFYNNLGPVSRGWNNVKGQLQTDGHDQARVYPPRRRLFLRCWQV